MVDIQSGQSEQLLGVIKSTAPATKAGCFNIGVNGNVGFVYYGKAKQTPPPSAHWTPTNWQLQIGIGISSISRGVYDC